MGAFNILVAYYGESSDKCNTNNTSYTCSLCIRWEHQLCCLVTIFTHIPYLPFPAKLAFKIGVCVLDGEADFLSRTEAWIYSQIAAASFFSLTSSSMEGEVAFSRGSVR